jgi:CRP-like cAMP-binding protein
MEQQTVRPAPDLAPRGIIPPDDLFGPLIAKLHRLARLDEGDRAAIRAWPYRAQTVRGNGYLLRDGQMVRDCSLVLDGHAFRSKLTGVGQRQILSFHRRGDLVDLHHLELRTADHNVQALNEARIAWIPIEAIRATIDSRPAIARALWRDTLIDGAMHREWILNVGRRDARTRIAHLLCELIYRRDGVPLTEMQRRFELPMSQEQIADATALTPVHVNRMLQHLEAEQLIARDRRMFVVQDWDALCRVADFNPAYLHLM